MLAQRQAPRKVPGSAPEGTRQDQAGDKAKRRGNQGELHNQADHFENDEQDGGQQKPGKDLEFSQAHLHGGA